MAYIDITPNFESPSNPGVTLTHVTNRHVLDGNEYQLDIYTNKWDNYWYFDLYKGDGTPLVLGLGLRAGTNLLYPYYHLDVPPGVLFVSPTYGVDYVDPTLDSFVKGEHVIYYVEEGTA